MLNLAKFLKSVRKMFTLIAFKQTIDEQMLQNQDLRTPAALFVFFPAAVWTWIISPDLWGFIFSREMFMPETVSSIDGFFAEFCKIFQKK